MLRGRLSLSVSCVLFLGIIATAACGDSDTAASSSSSSSSSPSPSSGSSETPSSSSSSSSGDPAPSSSNGESPGEEPPLPYVGFDINHILSTGQSNAVANDGKPVLSTSQPYANLMFNVGIMTATTCDGDGCKVYQKPTSFVPLVEGDTFFYPVETMSAGLANETSKLAATTGKNHPVLVSLHGRSGNSYECLRKNGCGWWPTRGYVKPFDEAMMQVADAKALATAAGKTYAVRAVTAIHGEHDHYAYSSGDSAFPMTGTDGQSVIADYSDGLLEWQRDYEASVTAITGQTVPIPLFINQYSHWNNVPTTKIAYQQLDAHIRSKGHVMIVGPTYALPYTNSCLHFTGHGERQLGEYFAKAYARVIFDGRRWEPLRPTKVSIAGNVVTAKFLVPSPPLVFDTTRVDDPGNYGFEWYDASNSASITKVEITGPDTVSITLSAAPTGADKRLRYAYTFGGCGGPRTLARGNLRDSDTTPSQHGYDLFNWAVHFDEPVQ